jgi:hypothetical protein
MSAVTSEFDPTGADPHGPGAKLDGGKVLASLLADFSMALLAVAEVGTYGARKYSRGGWQTVPDGPVRYADALWRHLLSQPSDLVDEDSGLAHDAQVAWNALAVLELRLRQGRIIPEGRAALGVLGEHPCRFPPVAAR